MTPEDRETLIAQYLDGYRVVAEALTGIDDEQLDARPGPGKWTAREVVHHLADSEMTGAVRLRLLLAVDNPPIRGYDQDEFAKRLFYDRPIAASLDAFKAARMATGEILTRMIDADWQRPGSHTEQKGTYTPERWLEIYAVHAHRHAEQIRVARASARKPGA
jgi:DinB family protein